MLALHGLSGRSCCCGALPCWSAKTMAAFIIAQSGGQGSHGMAAAMDGAPATTSMIAASIAKRADKRRSVDSCNPYNGRARPKLQPLPTGRASGKVVGSLWEPMAQLGGIS